MFKTRPVHVSAGQCQASKLGFHVRNSLASSTYCLPGLYVLHCIISWFSKGWLANADGALSNRTCLSAAAQAKQHIRSSCWCSKQNASSNADNGHVHTLRKRLVARAGLLSAGSSGSCHSHVSRAALVATHGVTRKFLSALAL